MTSPSSPQSPVRQRRILVVATEDWFVASHFLPTVRALVGTGAEVAVATRVSGSQERIEATGARVIDFNLSRGKLLPAQEARITLRLGRLISQLDPDVIHAIAMKPIGLAGLIALSAPRRALVMHLTGLGMVAESNSRVGRLAHATIMRLVGRLLRRENVRLLVENPEDWQHVSRYAHPVTAAHVIQLGGAGVDENHFPVWPDSTGNPGSVAFVGRMIWWKGVDVLMAAHQLLSERGEPIQLSLYGDADPLTHRAISRETLLEWNSRPHVTWHGSTSDVRAVWRDHDIAVIPSRRREGLPRTLLEAAACGRPVIVTDVPGSRYFVRDGVEGLIVPPEDPAALADAIARLASDPALRQRMGAAARDRILSGFTETHVMNAVAQTYANLFRTLPG